MFEYVESVSVEGPLEKKGKFKTWAWSKYWFVLDEDQLCYYKDSQVLDNTVISSDFLEMGQGEVHPLQLNMRPPLNIPPNAVVHGQRSSGPLWPNL